MRCASWAIIAVFIASYVPARRAAQLAPVATLRGLERLVRLHQKGLVNSATAR